MTPTTTPETVFAPAGTATGPFATDFGLESADQLVVSVLTGEGAFTRLTPLTDYAVAAVAGDMLAHGASVTLSAGAVPSGGWAGGRLVLERRSAFNQLQDFNDDSGFAPADTGRGLDRLTRQTQELRASLSRALSVLPGDIAPTLPLAAARAGKLFAFAVDGASLRPLDTPETLVAIDANGAAYSLPLIQTLASLGVEIIDDGAWAADATIEDDGAFG